MKLYLKQSWKIIITDAVFFAALFYFIYFIRNQVAHVLEQIQAISPQLAQLQSTLQAGQDSAALQTLDALLKQMNSLTNYAMFLVVVLLPLGIYLLWTLIHTYQYHALQQKRLTLRSLGRYAIFTLPFFVILILIVNRMLTLLIPLRESFPNNPELNSAEFIIYLIIIPLIFILMHIGYILLSKQTVLKTYWASLKTLIKPILTLPVGLLLLVFFILTLYFCFEIFLLYNITQHFMPIQFVYAIGMSILYSATKIGLFTLLRKH